MKKLNTRGFSHVEMFLSLVVVVVIGALGFYAFNSVKDRSSKAESSESAEATEPTQIDNDTTTFTVLNTAQKEAAARTFTEVISDPKVGQVFVCKVSPNFRSGIRYYFLGQYAKETWVSWKAYVPGQNPSSTGKTKKFQLVDTQKSYKVPGTFKNNIAVDWKFVLKSNSGGKAKTDWIKHTDLTRCPS